MQVNQKRAWKPAKTAEIMKKMADLHKKALFMTFIKRQNHISQFFTVDLATNLTCASLYTLSVNLASTLTFSSSLISVPVATLKF